MNFLFPSLSFLRRENGYKIFNDNDLMMKNLVTYFLFIAVFFRRCRLLSMKRYEKELVQYE